MRLHCGVVYLQNPRSCRERSSAGTPVQLRAISSNLLATSHRASNNPTSTHGSGKVPLNTAARKDMRGANHSTHHNGHMLLRSGQCQLCRPGFLGRLRNRNRYCNRVGRGGTGCLPSCAKVSGYVWVVDGKRRSRRLKCVEAR